MSIVRSAGTDVEVGVFVVAGASRNEFVGAHGVALRIRETEPASEGRANQAVLDLVAEALGVPVTLVRGERSRRKILRAHGITVAAAHRLLGL